MPRSTVVRCTLYVVRCTRHGVRSAEYIKLPCHIVSYHSIPGIARLLPSEFIRLLPIQNPNDKSIRLKREMCFPGRFHLPLHPMSFSSPVSTEYGV